MDGTEPRMRILVGAGLLVVTGIALYGAAKLAGVDMLGLNTPRKGFLFAFNISIFAVWIGLTHYLKGNGYSPLAMMLPVIFLNIAISLFLWRTEGNAFGSLVAALRANKQTALLYTVPALLYSLSDVARMDGIMRVDPLTYAVLINLRLLVLPFLWERCMKKRLKLTHWVGFLTILIGFVIKEGSNVWLNSMDFDVSRCIGYAEIILVVVFTAIATVYNEKLLKSRTDASVNMQNIILYTESMVILALFMIPASFIGSEQYAGFLGGLPLKALSDPLVLVQGVSLALVGVSTAYVLQELSSVYRELANVGTTILCMPINWVAFNYPLGPTTIAGALTVVAGASIFSGCPASSAEDVDAEKPLAN